MAEPAITEPMQRTINNNRTVFIFRSSKKTAYAWDFPSGLMNDTLVHWANLPHLSTALYFSLFAASHPSGKEEDKSVVLVQSLLTVSFLPMTLLLQEATDPRLPAHASSARIRPHDSAGLVRRMREQKPPIGSWAAHLCATLSMVAH